jgi:hypothetical protein
MEVKGGSKHSQNEFSLENIDMNAHDQYKQGLETEIGTENPINQNQKVQMMVIFP